MRMKMVPVWLCAVLAGALGACSSGSTSSPDAAKASSPAPVADFGLPANASRAAAAAGLPMLGKEELAVHYHSHLDVTIRGNEIQVPAGIGIDLQARKIAPLHTHTPDGVVHIESATDVPFTLGQFFTLWGHPISARNIGSVAASGDEQIRVYRNGTLVTGDPAAMKFQPHDEIFVWLGPSGQQPKVPSSYAFPPGE